MRWLCLFLFGCSQPDITTASSGTMSATIDSYQACNPLKPGWAEGPWAKTDSQDRQLEVGASCEGFSVSARFGPIPAENQSTRCLWLSIIDDNAGGSSVGTLTVYGRSGQHTVSGECSSMIPTRGRVAIQFTDVSLQLD